LIVLFVYIMVISLMLIGVKLSEFRVLCVEVDHIRLFPGGYLPISHCIAVNIIIITIYEF